MSAIDESVLDDAEARSALGESEMLRAVATAGAEVRIASTASAEAGLAVRVAAEGRPRAVVLAGMGGSGIAGEAVAALCGASSPAPVLAGHGYTLPAWVGAVDLVIAVSCSGTTEETLAVVEEGVRRGARLLTIGAPDSPLAALSEQARGIHVPVSSGGRLPRANMWALRSEERRVGEEHSAR